MKNEDSHKIIKGGSEIGVILGLLFMSLVVVIARFSIGDGNYEWDILREYPIVFWLLIALVLILGFAKVFIEVFLFEDSYDWVWGVILIVLVILIFWNNHFF